MQFLNGITLLLIYQLIGEISVLIFELSVPGPVVGMVLLFLSLMIKNALVKTIEPASSALLSHLSLLFVPAGVGIMVHFERIQEEWYSISLALIISTILTMAATAFIMLVIQRFFNRPGVEHDGT